MGLAWRASPFTNHAMLIESDTLQKSPDWPVDTLAIAPTNLWSSIWLVNVHAGGSPINLKMMWSEVTGDIPGCKSIKAWHQTFSCEGDYPPDLNGPGKNNCILASTKPHSWGGSERAARPKNHADFNSIQTLCTAWRDLHSSSVKLSFRHVPNLRHTCETKWSNLILLDSPFISLQTPQESTHLSFPQL